MEEKKINESRLVTVPCMLKLCSMRQQGSFSFSGFHVDSFCSLQVNAYACKLLNPTVQYSFINFRVSEGR